MIRKTTLGILPAGAAATLLGAALLGAVAVAPAHAETVRLTSLDWPPYSGADLPEHGSSVQVARAAFAAAGLDLDVTFLPWQRAVATGLGDGYVGYFPEYYSAELAETTCAFSDPIGSGPLGFVESTSRPVTWETLDDLADRTIGTVAGYVNTEAFDQRVADGGLTVQPANDDLTNLRKVAAGRLDLAVIDSAVLGWLLQENPDLAGKVQMNGRLLERKPLYVCFARTPEADQARDAFNQGLTDPAVAEMIAGE